MSADAVRRLFAGGKRPRVLAAVGPEGWLREEALRTVAECVLGSAESPDVVTLQGESASAEDEREAVARFFDETRTLSLFGTGKVVALRNAHALLGRHKKSFLAWLANPPAAAVAVLLAEELPAEVEKAVEKAGAVVRCGGRSGSREPPARFAARRAAERGKRLGAHEAELLVELIGTELSSLEGAVEILALHAGEEPAIDRSAVTALFQAGREGSVWAFGDRLVEGDVAGALAEASRCFAEGVPEDSKGRRVMRDESRIGLRLCSAFVSAASRALALRRQLDAGAAGDELTLGGRPVPWFVRQNAVRAARARRPEALEAMLSAAEETERSAKSGGADGRLAVARLATAVGMLGKSG